jgi:hypothetical protein
MNYLICIFLTAFTMACMPSDAVSIESAKAAEIHPPKMQQRARSRTLTLKDAETILGEPAHAGDTSTTKGSLIMHHYEYLSDKKDEKTGKTGALYFLLEEYPDTVSAHKRYDLIKKANEKNPGVETLNGIGDEAYYHSDGENFYFVMVRKGKNVFNMKVNKITSHTSLEQFKETYKQITHAL